MTTVRLVAAHEVVRRVYPRPPPEDRDLVGMSVGKAIDAVLSDLGHQLRERRQPTQASLRRRAGDLLDEALAENAVAIPTSEREATLDRVQQVLRAYRRSEIAGLSRPRTRVCLIGAEVGYYAQPDFWDGRRRIFEMKSYRAAPPPPDVALQLRLFQLAFPAFELTLICFDRHAAPVTTMSTVVPPPTAEEATLALRHAYDTAVEVGVEKVLEYVEGPFVRYDRPPPGGTGGPRAD